MRRRVLTDGDNRSLCADVFQAIAVGASWKDSKPLGADLLAEDVENSKEVLRHVVSVGVAVAESDRLDVDLG